MNQIEKVILYLRYYLRVFTLAALRKVLTDAQKEKMFGPRPSMSQRQFAKNSEKEAMELRKRAETLKEAAAAGLNVTEQATELKRDFTANSEKYEKLGDLMIIWGNK